MKEGAGDPFEDNFEPEEDPEDTEAPVEGAELGQEETKEAEVDSGASSTGEPSSAMELPYKYRRENIQDGRNRENLFLREEAKTDVESLIEAMEEVFDSEDVYKFDVLEAAMIAAADNPELVEPVLEEMGYGMK